MVSSELSNPPLPSRVELLQTLIARAPARARAELHQLLHQRSHAVLASLLERMPEVGPSIIAQVIEQAYQRPALPRPEVFDLIAALPVEHFLTTSYDPWLKEAVSQRSGSMPRVYVPGDAGALSQLDTDSPALVLMLHGDADRPATCVLTARDHRQLERGNPQFALAMQGLAAARSFLFVGYPPSGPDMASALDHWAALFAPRGAPPRHVMLGAGFSAADRMLLLDRGVQPVDYSPHDPDDHSLLPGVLRWLASPLHDQT
ncbi:MAG: SIR2 family protein [Proteobacteria bacterium]|nr:SIR2 family protein [Pseudomonadota bacterium]